MATITITAGDGTFAAYVARPDETPAPVLLVIQEIFGVNANMRGICDDMARQGYIAVCPDLFWRIEPGIELDDTKPDELQRAFDLYGQFNERVGVQDLIATLEQIRGIEGGNGKAGTMGFCLGGKLAYLMATRSDADCNVSYYGVGIEKALTEAGAIDKPLLLHVAEKDQFVPGEAQSQIFDAMGQVPVAEAHLYPGEDHAFARVGGDHYSEASATLANNRTRDFLATHLT